jgi:hypothetical protein
MKKIVLQLLLLLICINAFSQETVVKYLSGTDKDHTLQWDFYCTDGRKSGNWTKIPVPSNWEQQGFGTYNYGHDKVKANEKGLVQIRIYFGGHSGQKGFHSFRGFDDGHQSIGER